jgi:hypothetical protein
MEAPHNHDDVVERICSLLLYLYEYQSFFITESLNDGKIILRTQNPGIPRSLSFLRMENLKDEVVDGKQEN